MSGSLALDPSIFKAYDIRGVVPSTLNEDVAFALGLAFGAASLAAGEGTVAVGRDGRLSGPALSTALMRGLVQAGVQVLDVGAVTTPMLYFAASTLCTSGIQVTGSHNPKDYNGFKMVLATRAIFGDEIQALRRVMAADTAPRRAGGDPRPRRDRGGRADRRRCAFGPARRGGRAVQFLLWPVLFGCPAWHAAMGGG